MHSADLTAWLVDRGRQWSRSERDAHRDQAAPLPEGAQGFLAPWFAPRILGAARYRWVPVIQNPAWRDQAIERGAPAALDFTTSAAITHGDTILFSRAVLGESAPQTFAVTAFHELVHVVQFDVLGVDEFVAQYIAGYLAGAEYWLVPLELVAYAFQARIMQNPADHFSVEALIRKTRDLRLA